MKIDYKRIIGWLAMLLIATFAINGCENNAGSSGTNNPNTVSFKDGTIGG